VGFELRSRERGPQETPRIIERATAPWHDATFRYRARSKQCRDRTAARHERAPSLRKVGMGKGDYPGEFEQVVMLAVARVGENAYAVPVHEEILRTTGRDVAIASVYVTLDRLARKRLVRSRIEPRGKATGRPRRFYALTDAGWRSLLRGRRSMENLWHGVRAPENVR